jgi:hypothetical protein
MKRRLLPLDVREFGGKGSEIALRGAMYARVPCATIALSFLYQCSWPNSTSSRHSESSALNAQKTSLRKLATLRSSRSRAVNSTRKMHARRFRYPELLTKMPPTGHLSQLPVRPSTSVLVAVRAKARSGAESKYIRSGLPLVVE